jgi:hypothetical protein
MHVRDAVEADADALAALAGSPTDVMRNLVHDRTVRVATDSEESPSGDVPDGDGDAMAGDGDDSLDLLGFVSFDVRNRTVHVTQIGGSRAACERLLEEPVRFATREGLSAELLVPTDDTDTRQAAEAVGFQRRGAGPTFEGNQTVRYRLAVEDAERP